MKKITEIKKIYKLTSDSGRELDYELSLSEDSFKYYVFLDDEKYELQLYPKKRNNKWYAAFTDSSNKKYNDKINRGEETKTFVPWRNTEKEIKEIKEEIIKNNFPVLITFSNADWRIPFELNFNRTQEELKNYEKNTTIYEESLREITEYVVPAQELFIEKKAKKSEIKHTLYCQLCDREYSIDEMRSDGSCPFC